MIPTPSHSGVPPQLTAVQLVQYAPPSSWDADNVHLNIRSLHNTIELMKALRKELEEICLIRQSTFNKVPANGFSSSDSLADPSLTDAPPFSADPSLTDIFQSFGNDAPLQVYEILKQKRISLNAQESLSLEAANSLISTVKDQLVPFDGITSQTSLWEQRSMAVRLAQKLQKAKRNKRWKKKKRKHIAELLHKDREGYEKADRDADEWRAREIAKDIARRKVESMKNIAKLKANEARKRLESELELVLVVEKLQELRSIRIQKLKKQGHFLPEEDDKFLERVRIAVEEEERQAAAAADTDATKDAIATAEVSRKTVHATSSGATDMNFNKGVATLNQEQSNQMEPDRNSGTDANLNIDPEKNRGHASARGYDTLANLPSEFYHYYHGSSNDMGTLIEVRRMWDSYIRPGGSRIPGHWVQPPPPANEVWASYLVGPKH